MRVVVVHGYSAGPSDHWFGWLVTQISRSGHRAEVLDLPDSSAPERAAWARALDLQLASVDDATVVVTHSLGTITVLRWLAERAEPWRLRGLVTVSGFEGPLPALPELDDVLAEPLDDATAAMLSRAIDRRVALYSDDDAIVPPAASRRLAARLRARTVEVPGAGHFLADEGFTTLPPLLAVVEDVLG